MRQMNNFMNNVNQANNSNNMGKENSSKNIIINFIFDGNKIAVQGKQNMAIDRLIKNFRYKLSIDELNGDYFFKGKKIDKDSKLTLEQSGISNEDDIYVFDHNDKNQKEKISKMLTHKYDIITITFKASTVTKTEISLSYYTKINKAFKLYCKKIRIPKARIETDFMFSYNGLEVYKHDNRTIEELSKGKDSIEILVYDINNIIGA